VVLRGLCRAYLHGNDMRRACERGEWAAERVVEIQRRDGGGRGDGGGYWGREICISRLNASVITVNSTTSSERAGTYARSVLAQFIRITRKLIVCHE